MFRLSSNFISHRAKSPHPIFKTLQSSNSYNLIFKIGFHLCHRRKPCLYRSNIFRSEGTETWTGLAKFLTRLAESYCDGSEMMTYLISQIPLHWLLFLGGPQAFTQACLCRTQQPSDHHGHRKLRSIHLQPLEGNNL